MFTFNVYNPANRDDFTDWNSYSDNGISILELRCHLFDHINEELFQKVCAVIDDVDLFRSILQLFTVLDMEYFSTPDNSWRIIARNIYMLGCGTVSETVPKQQRNPEKETEHVQAYAPNSDRGLEAVFSEHREIFTDTPEWENPTSMVVYEDWEDFPYCK